MANTSHTFSGTLNCASGNFINFLATLEIEGYSDAGLGNRTMFYLVQETFSVSNSPGLNDFELIVDSTNFLLSNAPVVRARWQIVDCAANSGTSPWVYLKTPQVQVVPKNALLPLGQSPSLSFNVRYYNVWASNQPPELVEEDFISSGIFSSEPDCTFRDNPDELTAEELAGTLEPISYDVVCDGAELASSESWRAGAVSYPYGHLKTFDPTFSPISETLFQRQNFSGGSPGIGVIDHLPFGQESLVYNFSADNPWDGPLQISYGLIQSGQRSQEFEGCSLINGWKMKSLSTEALAISMGLDLTEGGSISSVVRMFLDGSEQRCDKLRLFDFSESGIADQALDVAMNSSTSMYVLGAGGTSVSKYVLPPHSTESGEVLSVIADAEASFLPDRSLSAIELSHDGRLIGIEVTSSFAALHFLNTVDPEVNPILSSITISDFIQSWSESSSAFLYQVKVSGDFLALQILDSVDTTSYIVTVNLSDSSVVAVFENLGEQWCSLASEFGHFTFSGLFFGCLPQLAGIKTDGQVLLSTSDLQVLRSLSYSPNVVLDEPYSSLTFATGLDGDNFYDVGGINYELTHDGDHLWVQNTPVTFHKVAIPGSVSQQILQPIASPVVSSPSDTSTNQAASFPTLPNLRIANSYSANATVSIAIPVTAIQGIFVGKKALSFSGDALQTSFSLNGIEPGIHNLKLITGQGSIEYFDAIKVNKVVEQVSKISNLVRVSKTQSFQRILASLRATDLEFVPAQLTCAFSKGFEEARTLCTRLAKSLGVESRVVRVPAKFAKNNELLFRLRG